MARILGLDLGSHSLKAMLLETTLRGFTVRGYSAVPVPREGERLERLKAALPQLLEGHQLAADAVTISLPGTSLATHPITLPFHDAKKIEATLAFEVESQLPYDLSEAVYDYQQASADEKGANLLVGVVKKQELGALLEVLKGAKLDPRIVTHAGLVYQSLLATLPHPVLPEDAHAATAVIDLGHERTNIAIGRATGIEVARCFPGGGLALTKALATEFKVSFDEAQRWKEDHGAVGDEVVGADAERAAGAFLRALQPVLRELRPTIKSYTARMHRPVGRVLLCGGTSRLKGLARQLETDLGSPTQVLELGEEARAAVPQGDGPLAAQALALALRGQATGAKAPRFNLRRGEFGFKSDFDFAREKIGQLVAFAAVLLVLLIASGIVRNSVLERRDKQLDALLCDTTQRILGKCERDYEVALNLLKGKESPAAGVPKRSATSLLAELTQRVPQEVPFTMDQIVIDLDRVSVRCEAASSKQMEDIISALKTYACFKDVKEGKVEKNKDGSKVSFRLDIQVECPDDVSASQG